MQIIPENQDNIWILQILDIFVMIYLYVWW